MMNAQAGRKAGNRGTDRTWTAVLAVNLALHLAAFCVFCGTRFSVDSYGAWMKGGYLFESMAANYRFTGAAIVRILAAAGRNPVMNDTPEILLWCAAASLVSTALARMICETAGISGRCEKACVSLAVTITFLNVVMGSQMAGLLLCFLAIRTACRGRNVLHALLTGVFLVPAAGTFQFYAEIWLLFVLVCFLIRLIRAEGREERKTASRWVLRQGIVFAVSMALYYGIALSVLRLTGIRGTDRAGLNLATVVENLRFYLLNQHKYLRWTAFTGGEYLTVCLGVFFLLWVLSLRRTCRAGGTGKALRCAAVSAAVYAAMYLLPAVSDVHSYRAVLGVFGIWLTGTAGILLQEKSAPWMKRALAAVLALVLGLNIGFVVLNEANLTETNRRDEAWARGILQRIGEYEEENGRTVKKIAFLEDEHPTGSFFRLSYTDSAMAAGWARREIFNVFRPEGHEPFSETEADSAAEEAFRGKDWDGPAPEEQLLFSGDTVYVCCY